MVAVFDLYRREYGQLGPLNAPTPDALLDFNRWVLITQSSGRVVAFACFKTTHHGLKLGLVASIGGAAKDALKKLLRLALNLSGVYAEVSDGVERTITGHVPEVPPALAPRILGKSIVEDPDGRHYSREITNVGVKKKLLVGAPILDEG